MGIKLTKYKSGLDLVLLMDLLLATLDEYEFRQKTKQLVKALKKDIEPYVNKVIDASYAFNEELAQEMSAKKERMINQMSKLSETDLLQLSENIDGFYKQTLKRDEDKG